MADDFECDEDLDLDFRRLKDVHSKAGYRAGLDSGEESTIQQGFNEGFSDGVGIGQAASKLLGSISAVLCFINSKKTQTYNELKKDLAKIKENVEILERNALIEYEALITMPGDSIENKVENTSKKSSEVQCCGGNSHEESSECCSEEKDSVKQQTCGTNCCSQKAKPVCKCQSKVECQSEVECCGKSAQDPDSSRSCFDVNNSKEQQRDETKCTQNEEQSTTVKTPKTILDRFYRDIESLEKQFSHLIKKEIIDVEG